MLRLFSGRRGRPEVSVGIALTTELPAPAPVPVPPPAIPGFAYGVATFAAFRMPDGASIALSAQGRAPSPMHEPSLRLAPAAPSVTPPFAFGFVAEDDDTLLPPEFWIMRRFAWPEAMGECQVHDAAGLQTVPIAPWPMALDGFTSLRALDGSRTGFAVEELAEAFADAVGKFGHTGNSAYFLMTHGRTTLRARNGTTREVVFATIGEV
jgi:hypothetical protein